MRAFLYILLIAAILWTGFAWEQASIPSLVVNTPQEEHVGATPEPSSSEVVQEEPSVEMLPASQPGPLVGSQVQLPTPPPAPAQVEYNEEYVELLEVAIHSRINEERTLAGLNTLAYDEVLAQVAAYHSTDMAKNDYFEHEDEEGCDSACRVTAAGYKWRMVGENLFLLGREEHFSVEGASALIVAGWMGSEGHRENILQPRFTYEGVGVVIKGNSIYATEVFARPR
ncbi:MAG: CAP domain-containing protein [Candidatus Adlerbacteria bacterium]|nr:CAP domain-containing protein [Candidatus Adlerbacteria bacterium]